MHTDMGDEQRIPGDTKSILVSMMDAFFSVDSDWKFTYVDRQAGKILGREPAEMLGKSLWVEFPGFVGGEIEAIYRKVANERVAASMTSFYPDQNRWYAAHLYPADGGISIYFQDATERMREMDRLSESEMRFRLMAEAIPQIVWIADADGYVEFISRQWSIYTGTPFDPEKATAIFASHIHPEDHAPVREAWETAQRENRTFIVEHRIRSTSGEYRWFLARAQAHHDINTGRVMRWFGTSTDVHDRKLAESALRKSEARYRTLFESIDEGFCIIEMLYDQAGKPHDYRFLEVNPVFEQQTGLSRVVGKTMRELAPQHEEHWFQIYGKVALTGHPIRFENEAKALNRWYDVYAFRVDEPNAHKVAILFRDVTYRRQTEEELRAADRRKDEFLAMLAHELRNPLAPIGAAASLLSIARLDEDRIRRTSKIISRQVEHLTSLVNDLLDVSRVTRGLVNLEKSVLDAKRIVSNAVEQVGPLIEERRHHLTVDMPPESAFVLGDEKRLVQVIANLLNNAAKYTPEGGNIVMRVEVKAGQVLFSVSDNGIGIAPELIHHVFDLFVQAKRSSDRSQGGLGLGLALVKRLVELHLGSVTAQSNGIGRGSEFTVCLPRIAEPNQTDISENDGSTNVASGSLRMMVVDDNTDAAQMLAMLLEEAGHHVIVEHESKRALERARVDIPEVFLLDIGLPDMDGIELAHQLRSMPQTANSTLIAITGYGREHDGKRIAAAGFDHHFVKPVDTARLKALLAELCIP